MKFGYFKVIVFLAFLSVSVIVYSFHGLEVINKFNFVQNNARIKKIFDKAPFKINKTYAVVFYGRKAQSSILLRYLERNLKINGGILDKIVFAVKTENKDALDFLESIISQNKSYYEKAKFSSNKKYREVYEKMEDDDLIFKIDDDIVFIADGVFEKMVEEYLTKDLLFLSGNVVNHPLLSHVHARMRAIMLFNEVKNYTWEKSINSSGELDSSECPFGGYSPYSPWWSNPKCAALAHESLIYHIKSNNLNAYDFKMWDFHQMGYDRWSINFVLMRGKYANKMKIMFPDLDDDEVAISKEMPAKFNKHCYALGSAVVSHFSYFPQFNYLKNTDILKKYDALSLTY